ncbi:hypothetical protein E2C01_093375 [Portunus trituberculatus]|uniref:Uncharacterized protein n=1 Tax=Portunus trituberculatus TaxID=210409 RepID=A0A5B7JTU3_PORTR|nr:hypothetical protein [Portunus trituberculatus]
MRDARHNKKVPRITLRNWGNWNEGPHTDPATTFTAQPRPLIAQWACPSQQSAATSSITPLRQPRWAALPPLEAAAVLGTD